MNVPPVFRIMRRAAGMKLRTPAPDNHPQPPSYSPDDNGSVTTTSATSAGTYSHAVKLCLATEMTMQRKLAKSVRLIAVRKTDDERLLDVRRAVAESVSAIAIPERPK